MKPSAIRIERMLEKIEARLVPPPRKVLRVIIDDRPLACQMKLCGNLGGRCHGPHHLRSPVRQEAKQPSHARVVFFRFRKEVVLAGFAAEAQATMVVADKTQFPTTI
jgi:hypothetical protein